MDVQVPDIEEVVDLLGLEKSPKARHGDLSFDVECPFCGGGVPKRYHMHVDAVKNCYHCFKCSGDDKGTGVLDLYGRVRFGTPHRRGFNGGKLLASLREEMNGRGISNRWLPAAQRNSMYYKVERCPVAPDHVLDQVYSFIFHFPEFQLSDQHRENLKKRGLDDASIQRNGYATMPGDTSWVKKYPDMCQLYETENLDAERLKYKRLRYKKPEEVIAGLIVARSAIRAGLDLKGVPGSFLFKSHWCFMYEPGMLIPTRNREGAIVVVQARKDEGSIRYMTISAGGLPCAVTDKISRIHFPVSNSRLNAGCEVLVTEGPLKADIVAHLYHRPVYLIALHGVSNTRGLDRVFEELRKNGIRKVGNAFDMDKICNFNVRKMSRSLERKAHTAGLRIYQKCWDVEYARQKYSELLNLCIKHNVSVQKTEGNVFVQLARTADTLRAAGVEACAGKKYWRPETKGMDDFLNQKT